MIVYMCFYENMIASMLRCKICLRGYRTEAAIDHHFTYHEKHFNVNDDMDCPLCQKNIKKIDITEHFDQEHSTKEESQTCCLFCLKGIYDRLPLVVDPLQIIGYQGS